MEMKENRKRSVSQVVSFDSGVAENASASDTMCLTYFRKSYKANVKRQKWILKNWKANHIESGNIIRQLILLTI